MTEGKPIFPEALFPVQSARHFTEKVIEAQGACGDRLIFLLAELMRFLEYKAALMYCPDSRHIPEPPKFYSQLGAINVTFDYATSEVRRVIAYFVSCVPDNDRGYWHTRLDALIKEVQQAHLNHISLLKAIRQL